jgi:hypothetical protein
VQVVDAFRCETVDGEAFDPVHDVPVPELVDWYVTDGVSNLQVEHPLVRADGPGGGTNQQVDVFLDYFREGGNALFPKMAGRRRQLRHLPVVIEVRQKGEGFLL